MKTLESNKGVVIALILLAGVIIGYNYFAPAALVAPDLTAQGPGQNIVALYTSLQSTTLDTSLFSSPNYRALTDFSTPLPAETVGRSNPFDAQ